VKIQWTEIPEENKSPPVNISCEGNWKIPISKDRVDLKSLKCPPSSILLNPKLKSEEGRVGSKESDKGPFVLGRVGLFEEGELWICS
jgi:hypothetical protein